MKMKDMAIGRYYAFKFKGSEYLGRLRNLNRNRNRCILVNDDNNSYSVPCQSVLSERDSPEEEADQETPGLQLTKPVLPIVNQEVSLEDDEPETATRWPSKSELLAWYIVEAMGDKEDYSAADLEVIIKQFNNMTQVKLHQLHEDLYTEHVMFRLAFGPPMEYV